jgi:plastocyanin
MALSSVAVAFALAAAVLLIGTLPHGVAADGYNYDLQVSDTQVSVGDSVSVSWSGSCSHSDFTGCYDWIAPFIAGACNGYNDPTPEDTCYYMNDWYWITQDGNSADSGSISFVFDSPGVYEFRIPYCGCDECELGVDNFAECSAYESFGMSETITVQPPYGLDLDGYSFMEQVAIGALWEFAEQEIDAVKQMLSQTPSEDDCGESCICYARKLEGSVNATYYDFTSLFDGFSMEGLKTCVSDVTESIRNLDDVFDECQIDQILGTDIAETILESLGALLVGLGEVEDAVEMAIHGRNIYTWISNAALSYRYDQPFAMGVNMARLVNVFLASNDAMLATQNLAVQHPDVSPTFYSALAVSKNSTDTAGMIRHRDGGWEPCALRSSRLCRVWV